MNKESILACIIEQLRADLQVSEQAVKMARDTATHSDCLGSSKYETMGLEASYLAQGQGIRLLEIERAMAYFKQLKVPQSITVIAVPALLTLCDDHGVEQHLWLSADAAGMKIQHDHKCITLITPKSPLGRALIGKSAGDLVEITVASQQREFEVLALY